MDNPTGVQVPHEWESTTIKGLPVSCHHCFKPVLAVFKCKACGFTCHKECLAKIGYRTQNCLKKPYVPDKNAKEEKEKREKEERKEKERREKLEKEEKKEKRSLSGFFGKKKGQDEFLLDPVADPKAPASPPQAASTSAPAAPAPAAPVKEAHSFDVANLTRPTYCDLCKAFIWGLAKQAFRCKVCQFTIHKKCLIKVPPTNKCITDQAELVKKLEELQEQLKKAESTKDVKATADAGSSPASPTPKVENLEISKPATAATGGGAPDAPEEDDDEDMCVICWQEKINTECGHRCVCLGCSAGMDSGKPCPICRAPVVRVVRIYDAH